MLLTNREQDQLLFPGILDTENNLSRLYTASVRPNLKSKVKIINFISNPGNLIFFG